MLLTHGVLSRIGASSGALFSVRIRKRKASWYMETQQVHDIMYVEEYFSLVTTASYLLA